MNIQEIIWKVKMQERRAFIFIICIIAIALIGLLARVINELFTNKVKLAIQVLSTVTSIICSILLTYVTFKYIIMSNYFINLFVGYYNMNKWVCRFIVAFAGLVPIMVIILDSILYIIRAMVLFENENDNERGCTQLHYNANRAGWYTFQIMLEFNCMLVLIIINVLAHQSLAQGSDDEGKAGEMEDVNESKNNFTISDKESTRLHYNKTIVSQQ